MKPLETSHQCLIWLCVHPAHESTENRQKMAYTAIAVATLTLHLTLFIGCLVFCWEFLSVDLERCMLAFMTASSAFGTIYMMIISITTMRHKVVAIFEDLTTIYNTSKYCMLHNKVKMKIYALI